MLLMGPAQDNVSANNDNFVANTAKAFFVPQYFARSCSETQALY